MSIKLRIRREPVARGHFGLPHSTFRFRIKEGLIPPPFKVGGAGSKTSGWLEHECDLVIAAMSAGKSRKEIKELVADLVEMRDELFDSSFLKALMVGKEASDERTEKRSSRKR